MLDDFSIPFLSWKPVVVISLVAGAALAAYKLEGPIDLSNFIGTPDVGHAQEHDAGNKAANRIFDEWREEFNESFFGKGNK